MIRVLTTCALLLAVSLTALSAAAQPAASTGFELDSSEWNGLQRFRELASEHSVQLTPRETLDLSALDTQRALILIGPSEPLDSAALQEFVADGGRLLLFDDFGTSDTLLALFSEPIRRVGPLPPEAAVDHLNDNPNLPILLSPGRHALLEGEVEMLVGNHPTGFLSALPAVVYYADGELGFAYDLTIGDGKMIVIGDSSIVINLMLPLADNRTFVGNALAYLCSGREGACEADLLVGGFATTGHYGEPEPSERAPAMALQDAMKKANELAQRLESFIPERRLMRVMTVLLTLGLVLFGLTVFPFSAARFLAIRFRPPARLLPESEFERNLREFGSTEANFALPLAILRDEFERLFLREVYRGAQDGDEGIPDFERRYRPSAIEECAERYAGCVATAGTAEWRSRRRQAQRLMQAFARVPARSQIFIDPGRRWSERDLLQLHGDCLDALEALGVREEYEQRTRRTA